MDGAIRRPAARREEPVRGGRDCSGQRRGGTARAHLLRKALITTLVAAIVFAIVYVVIAGRLVSLDAIPIGPSFKS